MAMAVLAVAGCSVAHPIGAHLNALLFLTAVNVVFGAWTALASVVGAPPIGAHLGALLLLTPPEFCFGARLAVAVSVPPSPSATVIPPLKSFEVGRRCLREGDHLPSVLLRPVC